MEIQAVAVVVVAAAELKVEEILEQLLQELEEILNLMVHQN
jgi:hypothetical protein